MTPPGSGRDRRASDDPWADTARPRSPVRRGLEEPEGKATSAGATRGGRLARGTDRGVRWLVKGLAALLWAPLGLVFWLPFLLRRTAGYLFAVLYAGLTGGQTREAERRWEQAVAFYQLGFRRIVFAFRAEDDTPASGPHRGGMRRQGKARFTVEFAWAAAVWVTVLWLTGLWPDAPGDLRSAALRGWEVVSAAAVQSGIWLSDLVSG